jgi:hypothetical protein
VQQRWEARREQVRVRARRHVDHGMGLALLLDVGPGAPLARAVLAVGGAQRLLLLVEDNRHDLPVALVGLPGEPARRILEAPEVVVVEVPVLQHDRAAADVVAPVDGARPLLGSPVARHGREPCRGRTAAVVEPPAFAVHGQPGRRQLGGNERAVLGALQVGIRQEVVDRRRAEGLGPVEDGDGLVEREQLARRQSVVGGCGRHERRSDRDGRERRQRDQSGSHLVSPLTSRTSRGYDAVVSTDTGQARLFASGHTRNLCRGPNSSPTSG